MLRKRSGCGCGIRTWCGVGEGMVCSGNCHAHSNETTCTAIIYITTFMLHVTCCTTFIPHASHMLTPHVTCNILPHVTCCTTFMPHVPHVTMVHVMSRSMDLLHFNCEWRKGARHTGQGKEPSALEGLLDTHTAQNLMQDIPCPQAVPQSVVLTCVHTRAQ